MAYKFDPLDLIFYGFPVLAATIFLGVSYYIFDRNIHYTKVATGEVIKMYYGPSGETGGLRYSATIKFRTENNRSVKFYTDYNTRYSSLDRGEMVEITYNEIEPSDAQVNWFFALWGTFIITTFLGLIFLALSIFIIITPVYEYDDDDIPDDLLR